MKKLLTLMSCTVLSVSAINAMATTQTNTQEMHNQRGDIYLRINGTNDMHQFGSEALSKGLKKTSKDTVNVNNLYIQPLHETLQQALIQHHHVTAFEHYANQHSGDDFLFKFLGQRVAWTILSRYYEKQLEALSKVAEGFQSQKTMTKSEVNHAVKMVQQTAQPVKAQNVVQVFKNKAQLEHNILYEIFPINPSIVLGFVSHQQNQIQARLVEIIKALAQLKLQQKLVFLKTTGNTSSQLSNTPSMGEMDEGAAG